MVASRLVKKFPGGKVSGDLFLWSPSTNICSIGDYPGPVSLIYLHVKSEVANPIN